MAKFEFIRPINIHTKKIELTLDSGQNSIFILGGWGVKYGEFIETFVQGMIA